LGNFTKVCENLPRKHCNHMWGKTRLRWLGKQMLYAQLPVSSGLQISKSFLQVWCDWEPAGKY
jgi:hypothetical protein